MLNLALLPPTPTLNRNPVSEGRLYKQRYLLSINLSIRIIIVTTRGMPAMAVEVVKIVSRKFFDNTFYISTKYGVPEIMRMPKKVVLVCAIQGLMVPIVKAQSWNFNRPICGNRAVGMAGAFTAISDDASAICYNPAGLAFSDLKKSTASATAYARSTEISKNAINGDDLSTESSGLKGFFGGMTRELSSLKNAPIGFAVVVPESGDRHQTIDFSSVDLGSEEGHYKVTESYLKRLFIVGFGQTIRPDLALGGSLTLAHSTLRQTSASSAIIVDKGALISDDPSKKFRVFQGRQVSSEYWTLWLKIAAMYRLTTKTNIGLFVAHAETPWRKLSIENDFSYYEINGSPDAQGSVPSQSNSSRHRESQDLPRIHRGPWQARAGIMHNYAPETKVSLDVQYFLPEKIADDPPNGLHPVWDLAVGIESFVRQTFLVRSGIFTSFDSRNGPKDAENARPDEGHVDEYGLSLSGSVVDDTSEYSLTTTGIYGKGRGSPVNIGSVSPVRSLSRTSLEITLGLSTKI